MRRHGGEAARPAELDRQGGTEISQIVEAIYGRKLPDEFLVWSRTDTRRRRRGNTDMSEKSETCGNCAQSRPTGETRFDLPESWLNCVLWHTCEYRSPYKPCYFSPSRWVAKKGV